MIRLEIPVATPSLNQTHRMHWAAKKKLGLMYDMLLLRSALLGRVDIDEHAATGRRKLTIERRGKKQLDADNAVGGCKILIDRIKLMGLLVDDNDAGLVLDVRQSKLINGEKPHTLITLEDM